LGVGVRCGLVGGGHGSQLGEGLYVYGVDQVVAEDFCQCCLKAHGSGSRCLERGVETGGDPNVYATLFLASQFEADLWESSSRHDHAFEDMGVRVWAGWGIENAGVGGEGRPQGEAEA